MKFTAFSAYALSLALATVSALIDDRCPDAVIRRNDDNVIVSGTVKLPTYYEKYIKHSTGIVIAASTKYMNDPDHEYAMINTLYTVNSMCSGEQTAKMCSFLGSSGLVMVLMHGHENSGAFPEADRFPVYWAVFMWPNSYRPYRAIFMDGPSVAKSPGNLYIDENIMQHEFAHALHSAIDDLPEYKHISDQIKTAYNVDLAARPDLFPGAYLRRSPYEMFAVATMIYHNSINRDYTIDTRSKLRDQARFLYDIVDSVYGGINFTDYCVTGTNTQTTTSTKTSTSTSSTSTKTSTSTAPTSTSTSTTSYSTSSTSSTSTSSTKTSTSTTSSTSSTSTSSTKTSTSSSSVSLTATSTLIPTTTPDNTDDNGQISGASTVVPSWMLLIASVMALTQLL